MAGARTGWDGEGFRAGVQKALDGFLDEQAAGSPRWAPTPPA